MEESSLYRGLEASAAAKDASELFHMISEYERLGYLPDREKAYRKILELRAKEPALNSATVVVHALVGMVPFEKATDEQIVQALKTQYIYMTNKLTNLLADGTQSAANQEVPHANP